VTLHRLSPPIEPQRHRQCRGIPISWSFVKPKNVHFGSLAEVALSDNHVWFAPKSRHPQSGSPGRLSAVSRGQTCRDSSLEALELTSTATSMNGGFNMMHEQGGLPSSDISWLAIATQRRSVNVALSLASNNTDDQASILSSFPKGTKTTNSRRR
jgi:hypothetical protein